MGVIDWSQAERDLYAYGSRALLDRMERQIQDQRREWNETYGLDSTSAAEINRQHAERMRKLEEDHKAWLAGYLASLYGDDDESPTQDVGQGQDGASATGWSSPAGPSGPGPGRPNPHAAELEEAERIRDMPMSEYAAERQRLIRPNQGMF